MKKINKTLPLIFSGICLGIFMSDIILFKENIDDINFFENYDNNLSISDNLDSENGVLDYTESPYKFSYDKIRNDEGKYVNIDNNNNPFTITMSNRTINDHIVDSTKINNVRYFNDDGNINTSGDNLDNQSGNEHRYSEYFRITFPPNVEYIDFGSLSFSIKDLYRYVTPGGSWKQYTDNEQEIIEISKVSEIVDSKFGTTDKFDPIKDGIYNDKVYDCRFASNDVYNSDTKFRVVYDDNERGYSDQLIVYGDGNTYGDAYEGGSPGWGHGHIGKLNHTGVGSNGASNRDIFLKDKFMFKGKIYFDKLNISDLNINEESFIEDFSKQINKNHSNKYLLWDGEKWIEGTDKIDGYDKIIFNNIGTYNIIMSAVIGDLPKGDDSFISKYLDVKIGNNSPGHSHDRRPKDSDLFFEIKDKTGYNNKITFNELKNTSKTNAIPIESSQVSIGIGFGNSNLDDVYNNKDLYDLEGDDYGTTSKVIKNISFNIPFYNWTFEESPPIEGEYNTIFNQNTNFYVDDFVYKDALLKPSYEIKIYTNSNIKFRIDDDPNISSVTYEGVNIPHSNGQTNTFEFETNFKDSDTESTKIQTRSATIKYKNKLTSPDSIDPVNQKIVLKFIYDGDSVLSNSNENQVMENIGDNSDYVNSKVIKWSNNEDDLLATHQKSDELNLIDYYKIDKNAEISFSNDQLGFINFKKGNILPIERYYSTETGEISKEIIDDFEFKNETFIIDAGIYKISLKLKTGIEYVYWIDVSNQFIDYSGDDGMENNNFIPIEFKNSIDSGDITYSNGVASVHFEGKEYHLIDFFATEDGANLLEKGNKKGWTNSALKKEESYSILSLFDNWDKLKNFENLSLIPEKIVSGTSSLKEKSRNNFSVISSILEKEIRKELDDPETNNLKSTDYKK